MTSRIKKARAVSATAEWLQPHRQRFLQDLSAQGYARCTLRICDAARLLDPQQPRILKAPLNLKDAPAQI